MGTEAQFGKLNTEVLIMAFYSGSRINTNVGALNAFNSLNNINGKMGIVQMRLASGKRINSSADDPAGYTLAKKLNARSRALSQASNNVGEMKNILSVAEGGLATINDIYVGIKEKFIQASNGSYSQEEVNALATQINDMLDEVDDIIAQTKFNGSQLLDNNFTGRSFQIGADSGETVSVTLGANIDSAALSLTGIASTHTATQFTNLIASIDTAVSTVSLELQYVGSLSNRLDVKESNLQTAITNSEAAQSRIMDADMAKEQLEATKLQILQQTATTQLAQANTAPQNILQLFR
jgi:flagellin